MGTGREFRKKPLRRPKKSGCEHTRRVKVQKRRLVALGANEAEVAVLNSRQVKDRLAAARKA